MYVVVSLCFCQVSFKLNEELTTIDSMGEKASMVRAPRDHPFTLQTVGGQTLAVFTETSSGKELPSCTIAALRVPDLRPQLSRKKIYVVSFHSNL